MKCHNVNSAKLLNLVEVFKPVNELLGDKDYVAGDTLTYADFTLFELYEYGNHLCFGTLYNEYPAILKLVWKIRQIERIKEYLESGQLDGLKHNNKNAKVQ